MINRALLILVSGAILGSAHAGESCSAKSGADFKPLVELYTSEGCSSCPPADRWLSTQTNRTDINLLAFHVDYWDDIGWPDRFASPAYSQRQRQRVRGAQSSSVYTPQVMVGSNVTVTWRSRGNVNEALKAQPQGARPSLALEFARGESATEARLSASPGTSPVSSGQIWLAQYLDGQTSNVRAGENRGSTLHHDRVVQKLWGPWPLNTATETRVQSIQVPNGEWGLVAFIQDDHGRTLQSLGLPASACTDVTGNLRSSQ